jgi:hypothetical protein
LSRTLNDSGLPERYNKIHEIIARVRFRAFISLHNVLLSRFLRG